MDPRWLQNFFDREYLRLWSGSLTPARTDREAADIWALLELGPGSRLLDAPCGYGRLSLPLAERGATVLGVDLAVDMIAEAERNRGGLSNLRYLLHDLREPLPEGRLRCSDERVLLPGLWHRRRRSASKSQTSIPCAAS